MARIVISYRPQDSVGVAVRLYDRLIARFGAEAVLMAVEAEMLRANTRPYLSDAISQCDVLIVTIGNQWLGAHRFGRRYQDDPADGVRIAIAGALQERIPIIPVLIGSASMPRARQMPPELAEFAEYVPVRLDLRGNFHGQMNQLIQTIEEQLRNQQVASEIPARLLWRMQMFPDSLGIVS
jgi:hypothetical protein